MKKTTTLFIATCIAIFSILEGTAQIVTQSGDGNGEGTLRKEIADTPSGGVITFTVSTVTLDSELIIDKNLTITGTDVTIDAASMGRAFNITSGNVVLNGLTITNGLAENGGAIYMTNANVTLNNCILKGNIANGASGSGGAIYNDAGGILTVNDSEITSNLANRAGGGIEDNSGAGLGIILLNVKLDSNDAGVASGNAAPGNGGGLHITGAGSSSITGGTANNNVAAKEGGALWNGSGTMTIVGTELMSNMAVGNDTGGGALFNNGNGTISIDPTTTITKNMAMGDTPGGRGGAIFNNTNGVLILASGLSITGNYASRAGGAIEDASGGTLTLDGVTLSDNAAGVDIGLGNTITPNPGNGGAMHLSGTTTAVINNSVITGNLAASEGGGLWNNLGTMTVDNTLVDSNMAFGNDSDHGGGGLYNNGGTFNLQNNSIVTNNVASGTAGSGGGLLSTDGVVTISETTFSDNTSNRAGGAIEIIEGTLNVNASTMTMNTTGSAPGNGGAVHITGAANSNFTDGMVTSNSAAKEGGGLWNGSGIMTISGTMISENMATGDATGGGGIFNNGGTVNISANTVLTMNIAMGAVPGGRGGAIFNNTGGVLNLSSGLTISENYASRAGGAIEDSSEGTLMLDGVTLSDNAAGVDIGLGNMIMPNPGNGGAIHLSGTTNAVVANSIITDNLAASEGGGLWNSAGTMTVDASTVEGNTAFGPDADHGGGGLYNNGGTFIVQNGSTISNNFATGASGSGGGLLSTAGSVTVTGSTFDSNSANRAGGAIEIIDGTLDFSDSSMTNNDVNGTAGTPAPGNGGGLHVTGMAGTIMISNGSMVTGNEAASEGGGLWNQSGTTMTVDASTVDGNTAFGSDADHGGGGLYNNGGTFVVQNGSTISNNLASGTSGSGGGLLSTAGSVTVTESTFDSNSANRAGGAIEIINGTLDFSDSSMTNNDVNGTAGTPAPGNGGGLHVSGMAGTILISNGSMVTGNEAASEGGGLWNQSGTTMTVDASTVDGNTAFGNDADHGGGGLYNNGGTFIVQNGSTISNNLASGTSGSGGGLLSTAGSVTVTGSTFDSNSANRAGGAIEIIDGTLDFSDSSMTNNDVNGTAGTPAPGNGGGLHVTGMAGMINIVASVINDNDARREGGGLWNQSGTTMNVATTTIDGNASYGASPVNGGAGIFNNGGILNVETSTISTNNALGATSNGGAIHNKAGGDVTLMRSTISGNSTAGSGGGLYNNGNSFEVNAVTIALNNATAGSGGGIKADTNVSLKNTGVAINTASSGGRDVDGLFTSNNYNLIGADNANAFPAQSNDIENVDPKAEPLRDNGGMTKTHRLLAGSPAYNAGDPTDLFPDQIGQAVFADVRDIGAFEAQQALSISDFDNNAVLNIYPNPTNGQFNIEIANGNVGNIHLKVFNITGQMVKETKLNVGQNTLDLNGMASGLYLLNIGSDTTSFTHKLMVN